MNIIKPQNLKIGDTIGILASSGDVRSEELLNRGIKYLENKGFKIKLCSNLMDRKRYLAGNDEDKILNLYNFFKEDEIKAIISVRGGYGAIRLINKIDYSVIKNNPKIFCGYSDITALQLMILRKTGLVTYSAPMICSDFGKEDISDFTMKSFFDVVLNSKFDDIKGEILNDGNAQGVFWGGNLSTVVSLCGQDFLPDDDFIFFAEDLAEPVYKIDKMFRQLLNIEKFRKNCKGLVFGEFLDIEKEDWLNELFVEVSEELDVPSIKNVKISHAKDKLTVPIGFKYEINGAILRYIDE